MDQSLFAIEDGTILQADSLSPGEITIARQKNPHCALCGKEGQIVVPKKPLFRHDAEHPPDEPQRRALVALLHRHLHSLFPDSKQQNGLFLEGAWADLGMVRSNGAKLAVQIIGPKDNREETMREWRDSLESQRTEALFLLSDKRLPPSAIKDKSGPRGLYVGRAETTLLQMDEPLVYISDRGEVREALVPEEIKQLAKQEGKTIGRMSAAIRIFRINQLEIKDSSWHLDDRWSKDVAKAALPETLRARIQKAQEKTGP